jgi:Protein of Unknown function (DUF2604)
MAHDDQKVTLVFIINGASYSIDTNVHPPLKEAVSRALAESGNTGRPASDWQVRDANGNSLDPDRKISDFGFSNGTKLFLNLAVGAGGRA